MRIIEVVKYVSETWVSRRYPTFCLGRSTERKVPVTPVYPRYRLLGSVIFPMIFVIGPDLFQRLSILILHPTLGVFLFPPSSTRRPRLGFSVKLINRLTRDVPDRNLRIHPLPPPSRVTKTSRVVFEPHLVAE